MELLSAFFQIISWNFHAYPPFALSVVFRGLVDENNVLVGTLWNSNKMDHSFVDHPSGAKETE